MEKKMNVRNGLEYLCIYLLLLFKSGFYFSGTMSFPTSMILSFLLLISCLAYQTCLKRRVVYVAMALIVLYIGTELITSARLIVSDMNVHVLFLVNMFTCILLASFIEYNRFKEKFCNIIWVMCIASIIGWIIMKFIPDIANLFPVLVNPAGTEGHFAVLTVLVDYSFTGAVRAQGVFWEPGAFQTMIVIAMAMEFFSGIDKKRWKYYVVYVLAGLLTFSTTGIICIALMLCVYFCRKRNSFLKICVLFGGLVLLYVFLSEYSTGFWHYTLFRKLEGIFSWEPGASSDAASRIDSIYYPVKAFLLSPIWGIGSQGYSELADIVGHTMFSCTPVNYIAKCGIVFGGICYYGYWKLIRKPDIPMWKNLAIVFVLILSVSTEEFTLNPLMVSLIMYGYLNRKKPKVLNEERV